MKLSGKTGFGDIPSIPHAVVKKGTGLGDHTNAIDLLNGPPHFRVRVVDVPEGVIGVLGAMVFYQAPFHIIDVFDGGIDHVVHDLELNFVRLLFP